MSVPFKANYHRTLPELRVWLAGEEREDVLEPDLAIVDPHHHLREDPRGRYFLPELIEDVASGHRVEATVFVDSQHGHATDGPALLRPVAETAFVHRHLIETDPAAKGHAALCAGIVGTAELAAGPPVRAALEAHVAAAGGRFRGIRDPLIWDAGDINYGPRRPPADRMADPQFRAGFACLAPLGLSFDAWLFHHQLHQLADLAGAFPDTTIVLDHVGCPLGVGPYAGRRDTVFAEWQEGLRAVARHENVVVKLGGLGMLFFGFDFHLRPRPPGSAELANAWRPYIETCIEAFGPTRAMFESNFPVDIQSCSYRTLWNAFKRITAGCSEAEKAMLYAGTARRAYQLS